MVKVRKWITSLSKLQVVLVSLAIVSILVLSVYFTINATLIGGASFEDAYAAYVDEDYELAAQMLQRVAESKEMPSHGWFALADSLNRTGDYEGALLAYFKVQDARYNLVETLFEMSVIYAKLGEDMKAAVWYDKALRAGLDDEELIESRPELVRALDSEDGQRILERTDAISRSVEFILGEWSVRGVNTRGIPYVSFHSEDVGRTIVERQASRSELLATITYTYRPRAGLWDVSGEYSDGGTFSGTMQWSGENLRIQGAYTDAEGNAAPRLRIIRPGSGGQFHLTAYQGVDESAENSAEFIFSPRTGATFGISL